ncbi:MAG: Hydroxyacylglutathione hydrolase [Candidatus Methanoperedenaceae archaeon GB50]|nr:MAG: Hydroxyacylglutathione hydrolase [Candidatus Methanoperedenaceae archaeon GB50]
MDSEIFVKQLVVGPLAVCCYLVGYSETKEIAIIDPGGDEDLIINTIKKMSLKPVIIINTHAHPDHTAGNQTLKQVFNIPIAMHESDAGSFLNQANLFLGSMVGGVAYPSNLIYCLRMETMWFLGPISLKVIHTPGHTPGSICLYYPGHVFTGDTLFVKAVGRTDLPGGSWETLIKSIKTRLFTSSRRKLLYGQVMIMEKSQIQPSEKKKDLIPLSNREYQW